MRNSNIKRYTTYKQKREATYRKPALKKEEGKEVHVYS